MDEGPFRAPQPPQRRVPSRPEPATPRPVEEPEPVKETFAPKISHREERVKRPLFDVSKRKGQLKRILIPLVVIVVLLGLGLFGWSTWSNAQNSAQTGIDSSKYQAVFFVNGEVYFGKLQSFNDKYMKLTDIFYLQSTASANSTTVQKNTGADSSDAQLIKLGNEAYGPEDQMIISRDQVSRYMNLKPDSKVVQLIDKYSAK